MAKKTDQVSKKKAETMRCPSCGDSAQLIGEYPLLLRDPVRRHYQFDKDRRRMKAWARSNHQFSTMVTLDGKPTICLVWDIEPDEIKKGKTGPIVSQGETKEIISTGYSDDVRHKQAGCDKYLSPRVSKIVSKILEPVS